MESEEGERQDKRTNQQVWEDYVSDQFGWLKHFYSAAGEKGDEPQKKAEEAFGKLKEKLSNSHYNINGNYFKTFAQAQRKKYYQKKPYSIKHIINKISTSKSSSIQKIPQEALSQIQLNNLYDNFKNIIKYLTRQRYNMTNVAKHIFREEKEDFIDFTKIKSFTFDVERGLDVDWRQHASEVLLYIFLKSMGKGIMELQAKGIMHLDLYLRNILLFGCKDLGDLSDSRKIANNDELMFKIIDFDNALHLGTDCLEKTLKLLQKKDQLQNKFQDVDKSLLKKNPREMMECRHANYFADRFDSINRNKPIEL